MVAQAELPLASAPVDYERIDALNFSTLKRLHISPKLCRWRVDHPEPDKPAFALGRAIHVATLEPERWAREYVVEPDFGEQLTAKGEPALNPKATKGYKAALAQWQASLGPGVTVIDPGEFALVERCARAIREHRVAGPLVRGGRAEVVTEWTDEETGTKCKARIDHARESIVDLKSGRRETTRRMLSDAAEYLYFAQLSWYWDGAVAARLIPADAPLPLLVYVQTGEPFDVVAFNMTSATFEAGRNLCRQLLEKYLACQAANYWPGLGEGLIPWELPPWAAGIERDDESEGEEW